MVGQRAGVSFTRFSVKLTIEGLETNTNFSVEIDHVGPLSESNKELLRGAVRESPVAKVLSKQVRLTLGPHPIRALNGRFLRYSPTALARLQSTVE